MLICQSYSPVEESQLREGYWPHKGLLAAGQDHLAFFTLFRYGDYCMPNFSISNVTSWGVFTGETEVSLQVYF